MHPVTGPGVTNASTPMGQAYADSIPVLVVSSTNATRTLGKGWGCLHEIPNQEAVTKPLTALSATALCPDDVPELVAQAFSIFSSARPRPVHLSVPIDVLAIPATGDWSARSAAPRGAPDPTSIAAAAEALCRSERPLIMIGGGAVETRGAGIAELAERVGAGIVPSNAGKGIVPDFRLLAEAFGCDGLRPRSLDEASAFVERALSAPRPTLIEVHQDAEWLT